MTILKSQSITRLTMICALVKYLYVSKVLLLCWVYNRYQTLEAADVVKNIGTLIFDHRCRSEISDKPNERVI